MNKRYYEEGLLIIRVVLGVIFLAHGWQKVNGIEGVIKFFGSIGLPPLMAYVIAGVETLGGIGLIAGVFVRICAAGVGAVMVGAMVTLKLSKGLVGGYEFDLALLAMAAALVLAGSSKLSLGKILLGKHAGKF